MATGRNVVYNNIVTEEKLAKVNPENIQLGEDFLEYLASIDRSKTTIAAYANDLKILWCYMYDFCNNKFFINMSKRELVKFQNYGINTWKWSSSRIKRVKATMSSLSNYVENILDDEFEGFKSIVRKIENPPPNKVMDKTVFKDEQLQYLLDKLVDMERYDIACMVSLAMNSGRRKSELPRMKISYFSDDNIIYGSLYKTPEEVKTKGRGSSGKQIIIYTLSKLFKPYLDLWLKYREENNIDSEWLIPAKKNGVYINEQLPISTMDSWADICTKILGIPFYWHSLRHYFTTYLSKQSIPHDVIQDLISWSSADMVSLYCDESNEEKFAKYFNENGIIKQESKSITDL